MLPRTYDGQNCSIARALEVIGERWTPLILREAAQGATRFEQFQSSLGVARNVLAARLEHLCAEGIMERRRYREHPPRSEYVLTEAGRDLLPVLLALLRWGDRHRAPHGPPMVVTHASAGHDLHGALVCQDCGQRVGPGDVGFRPGPGADAGDA